MANIKSINGNPIVVGNSGIEDGAVTGDKLADGSVSSSKIADGDFLDELHDIRLGANGISYDSAGNAVRQQIGRINSGESVLATHNGVANYDGVSGSTSTRFIGIMNDGYFHIKYTYIDDSYSGTYSADVVLRNGGSVDADFPTVATVVPLGDDCVIVYSVDEAQVHNDGTGKNVYLQIIAYDTNFIGYRSCNLSFYSATSGDITVRLSEHINLSGYPNVVIWGVVAARQTGTTVYDVVIKSVYLKSEVDAGVNLRGKLSSIDRRVTDLENGSYSPSGYSSEAKPDADAYLYRRMLPDYWLAMDSEPTSFDSDEYLTKRMNEVPDGKHFMFVTDTHWPRNAKHSPALMSYVRKRLGISDVLFGGDMLDQDTSKYVAKKHMAEHMNEFLSAFGENFVVAAGNHDINTANAGSYSPSELEAAILPYSVAYSTSMAHLAGRVHTQDVSRLNGFVTDSSDLEDLKSYFKMHYYIDDDKQHIRYIVLDSGNTINGIVGSYFGVTGQRELYLQMDFLDSAIRMVPEGYDIVVMMHVAVDWNVNQLSAMNKKVAQMLTARKTKGSVTINNDWTNALIDRWYLRGQHTYSYANLSDIGKVLIVGGDTHWDVNCISKYDGNTYVSETYDGTWNVDDGEVLTVVTQCDAHAADGYEKSVPMTVGNITEQCFEVVTLSDSGVAFTRFGVGKSRNYPIS